MKCRQSSTTKLKLHESAKESLVSAHKEMLSTPFFLLIRTRVIRKHAYHWDNLYGSLIFWGGTGVWGLFRLAGGDSEAESQGTGLLEIREGALSQVAEMVEKFGIYI